MPIKFVDLASRDREIREQLAAQFEAIAGTTAYVGGPRVAAFEAEFAAYLGEQGRKRDRDSRAP